MNRNDLKNYKHTEEWIKGRIDYIEQYKSNINRLNSILSDMPKGSKEVQDSEAEKIAELLDSVDELLEKVKEKNKQQMKILQQLEKVGQPYRNILDKCYIQNKNLVVVSAEMNYSYERMKHMHRIALIKFDEVEGRE